MSEEDEDFSLFAEGSMSCPDCGEHVLVPIYARIVCDEDHKRLELEGGFGRRVGSFMEA